MTARTPRNRPEMPADAFEPPVAISSLAGSAFVSLSLLIAILIVLWALMAWLGSVPATFDERGARDNFQGHLRHTEFA